MSSKPANISLESIAVKGPHLHDQAKIISADEAREALIAAVRSIPAEKLKNFRTGQITIVK